MTQFGQTITPTVQEYLKGAMNQLLDLTKEKEKLKVQTDAIRSHEKDVYAIAKTRGFDVKLLKEVFKLVLEIRKGRSEQIAESEQIMSLYRDALIKAGVIPDFKGE